MQWLYHVVRHTLVHWGYWAVIIALLAEDAGLPVPGETVLMFAGFLTHKGTELNIIWVILAGIAAATAGDNLGFLLGRRFGPTIIRWMKKLLRLDQIDIDAAKDLIKRHGAAAVFWARFIFGLRTIAGPLAGMLDMRWKKFMLYNALGAAAWVTAISMAGYAFASEFQTLLGYFEKASWLIAVGLFVLGYIFFQRYKQHFQDRGRTV